MTSVTKEFLTQTEILSVLRDEGYDVNLRTLRYWRGVGLLPPLYVNGTSRVYSQDMVQFIRELCDDRGRLIGGVLFVINLEGEKFKVYRCTVSKPDSRYKIILYTDKGVMIDRRDNLDGFHDY